MQEALGLWGNGSLGGFPSLRTKATWEASRSGAWARHLVGTAAAPLPRLRPFARPAQGARIQPRASRVSPPYLPAARRGGATAAPASGVCPGHLVQRRSAEKVWAGSWGAGGVEEERGGGERGGRALAGERAGVCGRDGEVSAPHPPRISNVLAAFPPVGRLRRFLLQAIARVWDRLLPWEVRTGS